MISKMRGCTSIGVSLSVGCFPCFGTPATTMAACGVSFSALRASAVTPKGAEAEDVGIRISQSKCVKRYRSWLSIWEHRLPNEANEGSVLHSKIWFGDVNLRSKGPLANLPVPYARWELKIYWTHVWSMEERCNLQYLLDLCCISQK